MSKAAIVAAGLVAGCGLTPLSNKIAVGDEAFVVVVGEGAGAMTDLFAAPAEGGTFRQLTFTRVAEDRPRLDPSGTRLAFVRAGSRGGDPEIVVMNLETGAEIGGTVAAGGKAVSRLGWTPPGDTVIAVTEGAVWVSPSTTGHWVLADSARAAAFDSLTLELVGDPPFGVIAPCRSGAGACVITEQGEETALAAGATDPIRWGGEAIGYVLGDRVEVRPLGGGRLRHPSWRDPPNGIRRPTHHPGSGAR
jgi:hypothetical protein